MAFWEPIIKLLQFDEKYKFKFMAGVVLILAGVIGTPLFGGYYINKSFTSQKIADELEVKITKYETNFDLWKDAAKTQAQLEFQIDAKKRLDSLDPKTKEQEIIAEILGKAPTIENLQRQLDFITQSLKDFAKEGKTFVELGYEIDLSKKELKREKDLTFYYFAGAILTTVASFIGIIVGIYLIRKGSAEWDAAKGPKPVELWLPNSK